MVYLHEDVEDSISEPREFFLLDPVWRTQFQMENMLPAAQRITKPIVVYRNASDLATLITAWPNSTARTPMMIKRIARPNQLKISRRTREYFNALAVAMTSVYGNGGGRREAVTTATPARLPAFFFNVSKRFFPAIFSMPGSPGLRAARSRQNTPAVEPVAAIRT